MTGPARAAGITINGGTLTVRDNAVLVSSADVVIANGALVAEGAEIVVYSTWSNTGGTFTAGSSTVTFAGAGTNAILSRGSPFTNLVLNGTGQWRLQDPVTVANQLTLSTGTLNTTASNFHIGVGGDVNLDGGTLALNNASMTITGSWNRGAAGFNPGASTVTFSGASGSTSSIRGSSVFSSFGSTTPGKVLLLQESATQTVTGVLRLNGALGNRLAIRSALTDSPAYLINTGSNTVSYAQARDINAGGGNPVIAVGTSLDEGNNVNWIFDPPTPDNPAFSTATANSLSFTWTATPLTGQTFLVHLATSSNFTGTVSSSQTVLSTASFPSLAVNTTYFARVASVISATTGAWTSTISTATLASVPVTAVSTWTVVNVTSVTVTWNPGLNPARTLYSVELATSSNFTGILKSSDTYLTTATVRGLSLNTQYFARVFAINHSFIPTAAASLGSTVTATLPGVTWAAPVPGNWNVASNWSPARVPGAGDSVFFTSLSTSACVVNITTGVVTISIDGSFGNGTVTVQDGVSLSASGAFIQEAGAFVLGNSTFSIGTFWSRLGGSFSAGGSTVVFNGSGTGSQSITSGGGVFNHVIINGGQVSYETVDPFSARGQLSLRSGTFHTGIDNQSITVSSHVVIAGSTLTLNASNMVVGGDWTFQSGGIEAANALVVFNGTGTRTLNSASRNFGRLRTDGANLTLTLASPLNVLSGFTVSRGTVTTSPSNFTIRAATVTLAGGTLTLNSSSVTVTAGWTKTSGTLNASGSTVTFAPSQEATLSGSTTFYGLRAVTPGTTIWFAVQSTQAVANMVEFSDVALRPLTSGASWYLRVTGSSRTFRRVIVEGSNASSGSAAQADDESVDAGGNTNWVFGVAPAPILNLTALSGPGPRSITLTWTAPGDDGEDGQIDGGLYRVVYSSVQIITGADFDAPPFASTTVDISTSGVVPGTPQSLTLTGLLQGRPYWFAIRTRDESDNFGLWRSSNDVASANTLASTQTYANIPPSIQITGAPALTNGATVAFSFSLADSDDDQISVSFSRFWSGAYGSGNIDGPATLSTGTAARATWYVHLDGIQAESTAQLRISAFDPLSASSQVATAIFSFDTLAPRGIAPAFPDNGATAVSTDTALIAALGNDASAIVSYEFEIDDDVNFGSSQASGAQGSPAWVPGALASGATYYWRTRGADQWGHVAAWSSTRSFSTPAVSVYDFGGGTNAFRRAFESLSGDLAGINTGTAFTAIKVQGIGANDALKSTTTGSANNVIVAQRFFFDINEASGALKQLDISWTGYARTNSGVNQAPSLFIWNHNTAAWVQAGQGFATGTDQTISTSVTTGLGFYILGSSVHVKVRAPAVSRTRENIYSNYVSLTAIQNDPPTPPNAISLSPVAPALGDDVTVQVSGAADPTPEDRVTYQFRWYRDGAFFTSQSSATWLQNPGATPFSVTLSSSNFDTGETWYVEAWAEDASGHASTGTIRLSTFTILPPPDAGRRYWVSPDPGSWSDTDNWSVISGGPSGASAPASSHTVVFDGAAGAHGAADLVGAVHVATLTVSGYAGTLRTNDFGVTVSSAFVQSGGSVVLGGSNVNIGGDFLRTGGSMDAGGSTITFSGEKNQTLTPGATSLASIIVDKTGGGLSLGGHLTLRGHFTVQAGTMSTGANYSVSVASGDVTISGGRFVMNASTMLAGGNWTATGGEFLAGTSTVTFQPHSSAVRTIASGGNSFAHAIFNRLNGQWALGDAFTAAGNLTIASGTLDTSALGNHQISVSSDVTLSGGGLTLNASLMTVGGRWSRTGATFAAGTSTVSLTGAAQTLAGSTTFYALRAITAGATLQFTAGTTQYVSHSVNLQDVTLRSTADNSAWHMVFTGSDRTLLNLRVRDSNAAGGAVMAALGQNTDIANNLNWDFGAPGAITSLTAAALSPPGTLNLTWAAPGDDGYSRNLASGVFRIFYSTAESDMASLAATSAGTGSLNRVDLSTSGVIAGSSRAHRLSGLIQGGTYYVRIFTQDSVLNWSALSVGATAAPLISPIAADRFWVAAVPGNWSDPNNWSTVSAGPGGASVPSATHTVVFDGEDGRHGNATIDMTVSVATIAVTGYAGVINTGGFAVSISSAFIQTSGTVSLGTSTLALNGSFTRSAGTYNHGASTTTLGGGANQTISGATFGHLVVNKTAGAATLASPLNVRGFLTLSAGTLATGSGNYAIDAGSGVVLSGGALQLNASTMTVGGSWNATAGAFAAGTSTVTMNASGAAQLRSSGMAFNTLVIQNGNWSLQDRLDVGRDFVQTAGSFDSQNFFITVSSQFIRNGGSANIRSSSMTVGGSWLDAGGNWTMAGATVTLTASAPADVRGLIPGRAIFDGSGSWTLADALSAGDIEVRSGSLNTSAGNHSLTLLAPGGREMTLSGGSLSLNASSVTAVENIFFSGGVFNAGASTIGFRPSAARILSPNGASFSHIDLRAQPGGSLTLGGPLSMTHGLTVSTGAFATAGHALTVSGYVAFSSGSVQFGSSTVNVGGNWSMGSPSALSFSAGSSTVTLTGGGRRRLLGSTSFYALRALTPGATLEFTAGTTQYVSSFLAFEGPFLRSQTNGATWYLRLSGLLQSIASVNVRDSNASGGQTIRADIQTSVNGGNNTNWTFTNIDIGNRYWIAAGAANWNSAANWSLAAGGLASGGVPLSSHTAVFNGAGGANGDANVNVSVSVADILVQGYTGRLNTRGFAVTISSTFVQSSGSVYLGTSVFTVQGDFLRTGGSFGSDSSTITFSGGDNQQILVGATTFMHVVVNKANGAVARLAAPADIRGYLSVSGGTFTTSASSYALAVTSGVVINGGFLALNASTVTVAGQWRTTSGLMDAGVSTTTFTGSGARPITSGNQRFAHVIFNNPAGTWTLQDAFRTSGNLNLLGGTFDTGASGNYHVNIGSDVIHSGGALTLRNSSVTVSGGWVNSGGSFSSTGSTVTFTSSAAGRRIRGFMAGTVEFNGAGSWSVDGQLTVAGRLRINGGTLSAVSGSSVTTTGAQADIVFDGGTLTMSTGSVSAGGSWNFQSGLFNAGSSTVNFTGAGAKSVLSGGQPFWGARFANSAGSWTLADDIRAQAVLELSTGTLSTSNSGFAVAAPEIRLTSGTFAANGSSITAEGAWTMGSAAAVTFIRGGSTVTMSGTGLNTLTGSTSFYALRALASGATVQFPSGTTQYVSGYLEFRNVGLRSPAPGATWYLALAGNHAVDRVNVRDSNATGGATIRTSVYTSTDSGNNRNWSFIATDLGARYWVASGPGVWSNANNWSFASGGDPGAPPPVSTNSVIFNGLANGNASVDTPVSVSTIAFSGYTGSWNAGGFSVLVSSAFIQSSGNVVMGTSTLTLQGDFTRTGGNFSAGSSTIAFSGDRDQTLSPGATSFAHVLLNKSAGLVSLGGGLDVRGALTILGGTLTTTAANYGISVTSSVAIAAGGLVLNSSTMTVSGDWSLTAGAFSPGASTVTFAPPASRSIRSGGRPFHHVIVDGSGSIAQLDALAAANLTVRQGSFQTQGLSVDISSDVRATGGAISLSTSVVTVGGSWIVAGTVAPGGSTVTFTASGAREISGPIPGFAVFNGPGGTWSLSGPLTILSGGLTVVDGTLQTGAGHPVAFSGAPGAVALQGGSFALNGSTVSGVGSWTRTGGAFDAGTSTVSFEAGGSHTIQAGGGAFASVRFNAPGSTWTLAGGLGLSGHLHLSTGTLDTAGHALSAGGRVTLSSGTAHFRDSAVDVGGDWSAGAPVSLRFETGTSTVTLSGTGIRTLSGSATFHALRAVSAGTTVQFTAGTTQYVLHAVEFANVSLRSTLPGATWYFAHTGSSQTLVLVNARDSNAALGSMMVARDGSVDSGNNTNWMFGIAPDGITDLQAATGSHWSRVELTWTATGDDGQTGVLDDALFRVRYSSAQMLTSTTFDAPPFPSAYVDISTSGVMPGDVQTVVVTGLSPATRYWFAVKTRDEAGNWSVWTSSAESAGVNLLVSTVTLANAPPVLSIHTQPGLVNGPTVQFAISVSDPDDPVVSVSFERYWSGGFAAGNFLGDGPVSTGVAHGATWYALLDGIEAESSSILRATVVDPAGAADQKETDVFEFDSLGPRGVTPAFPSDGAGGISLNTSLVAGVGEDVSTVAFYRFEIDDQVSFASSELSPLQSADYWSPSGLAPGVTYYWRTQGQDAWGTFGAWSATRSFTTAAESVYDFSAGSSTARRAYERLNGDITDIVTGTEFTAAKYAEIASNDVSRATTTGSANNTPVAHRFLFRLDQSSTEIKSITVTWTGYSRSNTSVDLSPDLWLWNFNSGSWEQVAAGLFSSTDQSVSTTVTVGRFFIAESSVHVKLRGPAIAGTRTNLYTNYIRVTATPNDPPTPPTTISVLPASPAQGDAVTAQVGGSRDPDLGDRVIYRFNWFRNSIFYTSQSSDTLRQDPGVSTFSVTLASSSFTAGETWYIESWAEDQWGHVSTTSIRSSTVTIGSPPDQGVRYWIGTSPGNWNSPARWSVTSGGFGGASVPASTHSVVFDGAGGANGNAVVNMPVQVATLTISGFSGTIQTQGFEIAISSAFEQASGTVELGTSAVSIGGAFVRTGGQFVAGTSTVTFSAPVQTLSGSSTFYAIRALTSGSTVEFAAGTTQYATSLVEFRNLTLKSSSDGTPWSFNFTGSSRTVLDVRVRDSNASGATMIARGASVDLTNNTNWDFAVPAAVTNLTALRAFGPGIMDLSWTSPGDDGVSGALQTSTFTIQYTSATDFAESAAWSPTEGQPSYVYRIAIATTAQPGATHGHRITGLFGGATYYFRIWTRDDVGDDSPLSNGATNWASPVLLSVSVAEPGYAFGQMPAGSTAVATSSITVTNSGNAPQRYSIRLTNPSDWTFTTSGAGTDEFRLSTVFSDSTPVAENFLESDALTTTNAAANATRFAVDAEADSAKGLQVPAGDARGLWFKFEAPAQNNAGAQQSITVTITAEAD